MCIPSDPLALYCEVCGKEMDPGYVRPLIEHPLTDTFVVVDFCEICIKALRLGREVLDRAVKERKGMSQ